MTPTKGERGGKEMALVCTVHSLSRPGTWKVYCEITLQKSGEKLRQSLSEATVLCE